MSYGTAKKDKHETYLPTTELRYPIAQNETGGKLLIYNGRQSNHDQEPISRILLFSAGFPDDHSVFVPLASSLAAAESDCLAGVTCLPGFSQNDDNNDDDNKNEKDNTKNRGSANRTKHYYKPDGYTFPECAAALREAAKALKLYCIQFNSSIKNNNQNHPDIKITVIFHDWGVVPGLMYVRQALRDDEAAEKEQLTTTTQANQQQQEQQTAANSDRTLAGRQPISSSAASKHLSLAPDQVVLFDILASKYGAREAKEQPLKAWYKALVIFSYQHAFSLVFLVHRYVSLTLALILLSISRRLLILFRLFPLVPNIDTIIMQKPTAGLIYKMYIYKNFWATIYNGQFMKSIARDLLVPLDKVSLLFMYGKQKYVQFHEELMVEHLNSRNKSDRGLMYKAVEVATGGHWFYLQEPELTFREVRDFVFDVDK